MVYVDSLGIYVNKVEDLRDKVSEDMYSVIEHLISVENEEIEEKYFDLQDEFEVCEQELKDCRGSFNEILSLTNRFNNMLDDLYEYISDSKRIDRKKILSKLKHIEMSVVEKIINQI